MPAARGQVCATLACDMGVWILQTKKGSQMEEDCAPSPPALLTDHACPYPLHVYSCLNNQPHDLWQTDVVSKGRCGCQGSWTLPPVFIPSLSFLLFLLVLLASLFEIIFYPADYICFISGCAKCKSPPQILCGHLWYILSSLRGG